MAQESGPPQQGENTHSPPANVNTMINDLIHHRGGAQEILAERGLPGLFDAYSLTEEQRSAFAKPGWEEFGRIGIPPILQILLATQIVPPAREHLSMSQHLERWKTEVYDQA